MRGSSATVRPTKATTWPRSSRIGTIRRLRKKSWPSRTRRASVASAIDFSRLRRNWERLVPPAGAKPSPNRSAVSAETPRFSSRRLPDLARRRRAEDVLVEPGREAVDLDDPLAQLGALPGLRRLASQLHAGALGQHLERAPEVGLLGQLHELEDVAPLAAAEAVPGLLLGRHPEAGGVLLVEGAEAEELVAHLPQTDVLAHDLDEVGPGADLLFGVIVSCHGRHPDGI